jgi:hypothetical protein
LIENHLNKGESMNIQGFLNTIGSRIVGSPRTTVGGGVLGGLLALAIGKLETMSGCHFQEAFAGMDWAQLIGYIVTQGFGMIVTDSHKTVPTGVPTAPAA